MKRNILVHGVLAMECPQRRSARRATVRQTAVVDMECQQAKGSSRCPSADGHGIHLCSQRSVSSAAESGLGFTTPEGVGHGSSPPSVPLSMQQLLPGIFAASMERTTQSRHSIIKTSVCLDTDIVFRHAHATMNTCCSFVSSFGMTLFILYLIRNCAHCGFLHIV